LSSPEGITDKAFNHDTAARFAGSVMVTAEMASVARLQRISSE